MLHVAVDVHDAFVDVLAAFAAAVLFAAHAFVLDLAFAASFAALARLVLLDGLLDDLAAFVALARLVVLVDRLAFLVLASRFAGTAALAILALFVDRLSFIAALELLLWRHCGLN